MWRGSAYENSDMENKLNQWYGFMYGQYCTVQHSAHIEREVMMMMMMNRGANS